jgi:CPSF A subunit region
VRPGIRASASAQLIDSRKSNFSSTDLTNRLPKLVSSPAQLQTQASSSCSWPYLAALNSLVLLDKESFETIDSKDFKPMEQGNCIQCFERRMSSDSRISTSIGGGPLPFIAVGTLFMNLEEHIPSKGNLLIYEVTPQRKLVLRHTEAIQGSVQAIAFADEGRYIVAGVQQEVRLYSLLLT